ncbi:MAG: mannosyl-3-phosphoglycerate phosphatase [Deltaproteobacteria bacterium CG_4_8_14_3_um_filter_45_9]|nr:MAG: mannosyl-3-phosphoglycerate phosphatase [Deltaproteobacteria bacterium CG03_land_8_20_14_0_80_45_14]PIX22124.1 MAG: mannosyl-3-phosphoglycerate phosphatase [Deltaproteobacteria bacterium CG_4_8_14_3_um_filter_45_9]
MQSTTITRKIMIFSDLDGTLLDRDTYSFEPALPALRVIKQKGIPLVLSSSKTRAEIELYRKKLENDHPFISENGGAVFIPKGYFSFQFPYDRELEEYFVLELGTFYLQIVEVFNSIKKETRIPIKGFSDLTEDELTSLCGLSLREAEFAKKREYDEPFIIEGGKKEIEIVKRKIKEKGMNYVWGGKFHHILSKNDKGKAVEILRELYENQFFSIYTVGIGDNVNDIPMLRAVDHPILFKGEDSLFPEELSTIQNLTIVEGTGPQAWNEAILRIVAESEI